MIDKDLILIKDLIEDHFFGKVEITSLDRTFKQQVNIYKARYGNYWEKHIAWNSRHVTPTWLSIDSQAMDIKVKIEDNYVSGKRIANAIKIFQEQYGVETKLGIGIGNYWIHIDKREENKSWKYDNVGKVL